MSDKRNAIIERMRKVLALAKGGEGGERNNAERQLEAMLKKHGLTMADIDDETVEQVKVEFRYVNEFEERLAVQTVCFVLDTYNPTIMHYKGSRSRLHAYMTPAQKVQCEYVYKILAPVLMDTLRTAYTAFLMAQRLYPISAVSSDEKVLTQEEILRARQAAEMSMFMDRKPINKAIAKAEAA